MASIGIICPPAIGHLNPMSALGKELQRRDHQVTVFNLVDLKDQITQAGLGFYAIGETDFPLGSLSERYRRLGETTGLAGLQLTVKMIKQETALLFRELPQALKEKNIELLLVDQITLPGGTIADFVQCPFITVCNALLINREPGVPPFFTHWPYDPSAWAILRNRLGNFLIERLTDSNRQLVQQQRLAWGLPPYQTTADFYANLAQICQLPQIYDFPRQELPQCFHYTGPLTDPSGREPLAYDIPFPFEQLTGQPLIYASLGTLQNRKPEIFQVIAEAGIGLDAQLVISLGQPHLEHASEDLPGAPIVVPYAPHQQLIDRSSLVLTHAGMNTTLGAMSAGVPLVAIPITNEQPGIAARLARTGAGEVIQLRHLSGPRLRSTLKKVLTAPSYKANALRLQAAIQTTGGVSKAANIIEQVIATGQPVLNP